MNPDLHTNSARPSELPVIDCDPLPRRSAKQLEQRLATQGRSDEPVVRDGGGFVIAVLVMLAIWAFVALVYWGLIRSTS